MIGSHVIRTWSKTQTTIALSSAEAELFGGVKTACESLGVASLLRDLGQEVKLRMHMDASAALGIAQRKGVGKVRHLSTGTLWLQEQQLKDILKLLKIPGSDNVADIFTKNLGQALMEKHLTVMGLEYRGGRATAAAQLHSMRELRKELRHIKADIKVARNQQKDSQTDNGDNWVVKDISRTMIRRHSDGHRQMFTPLNIKDGPKMNCEVGSIRTTIGKYSRGGRFTKIDLWKDLKNPTRQLSSGWSGFTIFSDKPVSDDMISALQLSIGTSHIQL